MSEKNIEIGKRIKQAREAINVTQEELGAQLGLNKSTVQRYEAGKVARIKLPVLHNIAKILGVEAGWLALKTDDMKPKISELMPVAGNIYQIPVYESVSAGFGAYADSNVVDFIPIVLSSSFEAKITIAAKVKGDSMYPKIEDGDIVIIRKQDEIENGEIAIVLVDGDEGYVKKILFGKNFVDLISINPEYMPKHFENEDINRLRIVGKVIGSYKKF